MKVLVTGATGFLGGYVVQSMLRAGCDVAALARPGSSAETLRNHPEVEVREADLRSDHLGGILDDIDVVVHLAAQVTGSDEARFAGTAVATERLLEEMERAAVSRLVLVSSYSVYDWQSAAAVLDESSPVATRPYKRDGYTVAKVWQERLVAEFADRHPIDVVIVRPGFIWGPGREDLAGAGIRLGPTLLVIGPRMRLPLTWVGNCADAVTAAATMPSAAGETLNIVDGVGIANWRYSRLLASLDDSLKVRVPIPYALGRALVAVLAVVMPRIFKAGGKLPGVLVPASYVARFRPLRHRASKAEKTLGWSPRVDFGSASRASLAARDQ